MCSVAERPPADNLQPQPGQAERVTPAMLAARRRKETLLPNITQLALEGHSSQAIADKLGMPKRTVNYWLQEARREWIARAALSAAEMFAADLARLDTIYREAMQAWRRSQSEIEVRTVQHTQSADGNAITKKSIRTQPQRGNAAFLTRATAAVMASWRLKGRPGPPGPDAIARELPIEADGGPLPVDAANEDLQHMNEDQLRGYRARLSATIEAIDELAEFHALDADDDTLSAPESSRTGSESLPPATESLPPETGSLLPASESSPPVAESSSPAREGLPPSPESPTAEQTSGKFGQGPSPILGRRRSRWRKLNRASSGKTPPSMRPESRALPHTERPRAE